MNKLYQFLDKTTRPQVVAWVLVVLSIISSISVWLSTTVTVVDHIELAAVKIVSSMLLIAALIISVINHYAKQLMYYDDFEEDFEDEHVDVNEPVNTEQKN